MNLIKDIDTFLNALAECSALEMVHVLNRMNIPVSQFNEYATWQEGKYTRNCLARNEKMEIILLCWDANAKTPIHDHGGQECWVYQVDGELTEVRYRDNEESAPQETSRQVLGPGSYTYMQDNMGYHELCNDPNRRGMTLHIYASPIDACLVYNFEEKRFDRKEMTYDTMLGELIS